MTGQIVPYLEDDDQDYQQGQLGRRLVRMAAPAETGAIADSKPNPQVVSTAEQATPKDPRIAAMTGQPQEVPPQVQMAGQPTPKTFADSITQATKTQSPSYGGDPDRERQLMAEKQKYGVMTDKKDPKYRMGMGQRILGTAANFLSGFGGKGGNPIYVGPGAVNNKYYQDEEMRKSKEANAATGLKDYLSTDNEAIKRDREEERKQRDADTYNWREDQVKRQRENDQLRTERDQARNDAKNDSRNISYDPNTKTFSLNGSRYVPKSIEEGASLEAANNITGPYSKMWNQEKKNSVTPRQPSELEVWKDAFKRDNGREPSADEIAGRKRIDKTKDFTRDKENAESKKGDELDKLEKEFATNFAKAGSDEERDRLSKALADNKNRVIRRYQEQRRIIGEGEAAQPQKRQSQQNAAPARQQQAAPAQQAPAQQPKSGDVKNYKGTPYKFDGKQWVAQSK